MLKSKLTPNQRITALKAVTLVAAGSNFVNAWFIRDLNKKIVDLVNENKKLRRDMRFAVKIIERFADLADESVNAQIVKEFEFDWVIKGFEDD